MSNIVPMTVAAQISKPTLSAASRLADLMESAKRQVWKSTLLKPASERTRPGNAAPSRTFPGQRSAQFLAASRTDKITA